MSSRLALICSLIVCALSGCALFEGESAATRADPVARFEKLVADVTTAVKDWSDAWKTHDVRRYLAAYARDFAPEEGRREEWEKQRRERVGRPGKLDVRVSELQVTSYSPDRATANFVQAYDSPNHSEISRKTLELRNINGRWLITREHER